MRWLVGVIYVHDTYVVCIKVHVWNAGTGQLQQKMTSPDPVIDLCPALVNEQSYLVALTEKQLTVYRWNNRS